MAVFVGSGGHGANPQFRSMFYPAFNEPAFVSSAWALLGPYGQDASGIIAGMRIGANLAGMQQNLGITQTFHIPPRPRQTAIAHVPLPHPEVEVSGRRSFLHCRRHPALRSGAPAGTHDEHRSAVALLRRARL